MEDTDLRIGILKKRKEKQPIRRLAGGNTSVNVLHQHAPQIETGMVGLRRLQTYTIIKINEVPRNGRLIKKPRTCKYSQEIQFVFTLDKWTHCTRKEARTHSTQAPKKSINA
jgi:hypothetical protein